MKRYIGIVAAAAVLLVGVQGIAAKKSNSVGSVINDGIVYVDLNRALNEVKEGKAAKSKLEADAKKKQKKVEIMQKELKAMRADLEKQRLILSQEALRKKEMIFQKKFVELQKTTVQYEQEFAKREAEYIKPISEKLKRVIEGLGKSEGYKLILLKDITLYAPQGTDITDKVIATFNNSRK